MVSDCVNTAVEAIRIGVLSVNASSADLLNHIERFDPVRGDCKRWQDRLAILNFQMTGHSAPALQNLPRDKRQFVYTLARESNVLFKGTDVLQTSVALFPSPPTAPVGSTTDVMVTASVVGSRLALCTVLYDEGNQDSNRMHRVNAVESVFRNEYIVRHMN